MDAKANTHICPSPIAREEAEKPSPRAHSAYLIVVDGGIPGTMVPLNEEGMSLGRSGENGFRLAEPTVSRRHAVLSIDRAGSVQATDMGSSNGTFVNGRRLPPYRPQVLADGDRIQVGAKVILKLVRLDPTDERFQRDMYERTVRDALTGLYNRAYFLEQIRMLADQGLERGNGLAVLMLDLDHFKRVNDKFGHEAGDAVLRGVGAVLRESTRPEDLVARYGGEEFIAALPVSAPDVAGERAESIRQNIASRPIVVGGQEIAMTASLGLVFTPPGRLRHAPSLVIAADEALYQAKSDGRNRVFFGPYPPPSSKTATESAELPLIL